MKRHRMKGGLYNPFFNNGVDIAGYTGMGSGGVPTGLTADTTQYTIDSTLITADNG